MNIGCSGNRPPRLGMAYDDRANILTFEGFAADVLRSIMRRKSVDQVISGMALGWDQAVAEAAIAFRIPLIAAIPFDGFESRWSNEARKKYQKILSKASEVVVICEEKDKRNHTAKYLDRDRYIVDHSGLIVAIWDGEKSGGTWQTIKYADKQKVPVHNVFEEWQAEGRPGVPR